MSRYSTARYDTTSPTVNRKDLGWTIIGEELATDVEIHEVVRRRLTKRREFAEGFSTQSARVETLWRRKQRGATARTLKNSPIVLTKRPPR